MDLYLKVRLACDGGMSQREAARHFGISRDTVRKMMAYSVPPGYRRQAPVRRPKLDAFIAIIDRWLDEDRAVPRKQRHTAKRVFDRLRDEHGFAGGYTIIKDYMRERDRRGQEVFVPLAHPAGHGQADFGEAVVIIGGVEQKAHFFVLDLPHSDACYVRAYPAAVAEAWVDGHIHAFAFLGAVPQSIVYDNDRCLVAKILPDGTRKRATLFSGFLSHYLIRDRYGRPGKGNDKGSVEGLVGYARRNFMVPIPRFATWDAFNLWLEEQCRRRQGDRLRGETEGVDCAHVRQVRGVATPVSAVIVDADGERLIVPYYDKALGSDPNWIDDDFVRAADAVQVDVRWPEGAHKVLSLARDAGKIAVLDGDVGPVETLSELAGVATHNVFSAPAAQALTGRERCGEAVRDLARMFGGFAAVTNGEHGCYWIENGEAHHLAPPKVKAVDTLAAGDVFHGAFTLAIAEGQPIPEAVRFANTAAAIKCMHFGGRLGAPDRDAVDRWHS